MTEGIARRNLALLMASQCLATGGTVLVVTIGGIVGTVLSPNPVWATLPMSLMVVGTAAGAVPAALLMRRIGRRRGFALAAGAAAGASVLGALALWLESFVLFCVCTALIGAKIAFSQQYRFAAAESVPAAASGRAVSLVLLGAVGGAFLGPELATRAADWFPAVPFAGSFLALAAAFLLAALLLSLLAEPAPAAAGSETAERRPLTVLARQPLFVIAVLGGVVGQGVMTFVMTATPISMHVLDGHSLADTASVIRAHVLAMYVPSLASAVLIGWFGIGRLMALGLAAFAVTVIIALQGHEYLHYWFSLVLLGIGWNFLFVGGTTLLVQSYRPEERFTAQAANDFSVFGVAALGSLLAGSVVHAAGWEGVLWGCLPLLLVMALALVWLAWLQRGTGQPREAV
ncbi:MAG: MFS transporter [Gammaproteobacteria bacterium]|nr:MFS transporter [Gammaproteobacteria bacterium]